MAETTIFADETALSTQPLLLIYKNYSLTTFGQRRRSCSVLPHSLQRLRVLPILSNAEGSLRVFGPSLLLDPCGRPRVRATAGLVGTSLVRLDNCDS